MDLSKKTDKVFILQANWQTALEEASRQLKEAAEEEKKAKHRVGRLRCAILLIKEEIQNHESFPGEEESHGSRQED